MGRWARSLGLVLALAPLCALGHPGLHEQQAAADAAIAKRPDDPSPHLIRGKVHHELGEWDAALDRYALARRLGADPGQTALLEAQTYLAAGWPRMAKRRFDDAVAVMPASADALIGRSRAWMQLDHPEDANRDLAAAFTKLDSISPALVLERRNVLVAAGRPDEALRVIDAQLERVGLLPTLQSAAIELESEAGRHDAALARLDTLLGQSPRHPVWALRRAEILEEAGRQAQAETAYREALSFVRARTSRRPSKRLASIEEEIVEALDRYALTQPGDRP